MSTPRIPSAYSRSQAPGDDGRRGSDTSARRGVEAAEAEAVAAYGAELTTRRQWREQYRKSYALLMALYPSDRRRVESFFKPGKKAKKKVSSGNGEPRVGGPTS